MAVYHCEFKKNNEDEVIISIKSNETQRKSLEKQYQNKKWNRIIQEERLKNKIKCLKNRQENYTKLSWNKVVNISEKMINWQRISVCT